MTKKSIIIVPSHNRVFALHRIKCLEEHWIIRETESFFAEKTNYSNNKSARRESLAILLPVGGVPQFHRFFLERYI